MSRPRLLLPLALALLALAGCADYGDSPQPGPTDPVDPPTTVSFAAQIQPILDNQCIGCHGVGGQAGLDLRPGVSHGNLVGVTATESALALVQPGQPDQSWFYLKLTDQQEVGDVMPPGGTIGSANLSLVATWIDEGAQDN